MERHFQIRTRAGTLRGMMHIPTTLTSNLPVVIVHGYFSANRVGPARLYVMMARYLCGLGVEVYRADFLGVGDKDGSLNVLLNCIPLDGRLHIRDAKTKDEAPAAP